MFRAIVLASAVLAAVPATASAKDDPWRQVVTERLTAQDLGLAGAPAPGALARAAIAAKLDVRRVALVSDSGDARLRTLRFAQQAGGLPVLWSEIDVAVAGAAVTSISATTVPVRGAGLTGARRLSRARAEAIAKRAVTGREQAQTAQLVAYAGTPVKPWKAPRRAWVVQLQPERGDTLCVVVDAGTGKVLLRYEGFVSAEEDRPRSARAAAAAPFAAIFDARGGTGLGDEIFRWNGKPSGGFSGETLASDFVKRDGARQATLGVGAVLIDACKKRQFCVKESVINGKQVGVQTVIANSSDPVGSHFAPASNIITLETADADNPDVFAHEVGHRRDFTWARSRVDGHQQVDEVEEGLADMFAYDHDHDPSLFEDFSVDFPGDKLENGNRRFLAKPSRFSRDGGPYPDTMAQYRCAADTDEHVNATILGHAYYRFVGQVGHDVAGDVLTYIPFALPPSPSFNDVAVWFAQRGLELYGPGVRDAANAAFRTQAGIGHMIPAGKGCPPPKPKPSPAVCAAKQPTPPECLTQSPPTKPKVDPGV
jgi:hypothetical protein